MEITPKNDAKALDYHARLLSEVANKLMRFHQKGIEPFNHMEAQNLALAIREDRKVVRRASNRLRSMPENVDIMNKALAVISVIATPDIKLDDDHKLEEIYAIAHAALGECPNPHKDDIEAIEIAYKQFKEAELL